jgi:3-oxoacyl-[acyl-carrier-protein] synthase III
MKAGIFGIGSALPHQLITNAQLEQRLDTTDEWIVRRTGIRTRHWLNGVDTLASLAADASLQALADAGRSADEVDHVIVSTITPDLITPGLAPEVAHRIGAARAGAVDVNAACSGFLFALDQAAALVESDRARVVLVCAAEALSRITDAGDRGTAVLFGDGAATVVVSGADLDLGVGRFELRSDGDKADLLYADQQERVLRMSGQEVYRHAVARMVEATRTALQRARLAADDLDLFVAHQANARIVEAAAAELGIPSSKVVLDVDRVANTSSASIPLALHRAEQEGRLRPGAIVGLAAFGAGFVWGAGVISWKERVHVCA